MSRGERRGRLGDQRVQLGDLAGEVVVGVQVQPAHLGVARGEPAVAGHRQVLGLAAEHAQGQPGQHGRVPFPGDQRLDHRPGRIAQHVRLATESILIPASSSTLASRCPSLVRCSISRLRYLVRCPQRRHLGRRDEAGPQQPVLVQLSDPLAVRQIRLAARDVAHVRRVAHAHLDPGTGQGMVDRPPVHAGATPSPRP